MMPESNALRRRAIRTAFAALALPALLGSPRLQAQNGSDVRILPKPGGGWVLERNGKPFSVLGAGGSAGLAKLKEAGGNSIRTWGADNLGPLLDEAQKLGLTVCVGIWFGHEEQGFHYNDPQKVAEQQERVRQTVLRYRNHPAVLMWALGNEMEGYGKGDNPTIWHAIHDAAHLVKQLDPHHPTMTVVAEIGGEKVKAINALCPEIDIIGINSYGGGPSLAQRYRAAGGVKPYIITEFGPPGTWETGKNAWGAALEKTSTQKAEDYRRTYEGAVRNQPLCMGSYAFTWGSKQEATATWYGMFLPDGSKLAAVDAMSELWTGKPVAHPCPVIKSLKVEGEDQVPPGSPVKAALDAANPQGGALTVRWVLQKDPMVDALGGETQAAPPIYPDAIRASSSAAVELKMPEAKGAYRLFAYVHSASDINGAAVANIPLRVREKEAKGSASENTAAPAPVKLPFVLLGNSSKSPFVPSGWMGNAKDIRQEEKSQVQPRPGAQSCLEVHYLSGGEWGGVVWQSPAGDWGDKPGGINLTGAKRLRFWARGASGDEEVAFKFGLLGPDKTYGDTDHGQLDHVRLTTDWKEYTIDLTGKNLTRIKTGFAWIVAGQGKPVTFYLDDVRFE